MATVQTLLDVTRDIMNATGSQQWSDLILTRWMDLAHWQEWGDLLNANRMFKTQAVSVTEDANGRFLLSALNTGSGDAKQWRYRIITVQQPAIGGAQNATQFFYRQATYDQFPNPQPNTSLPYVWYRDGDAVQVLPIAQGQSLTIKTSWRPQRITQLASTNSTVDFPEGYEDLIPWRAASLALVKGGSETKAANDIAAAYRTMHDRMLEDLGRESTWPTMARSFDDPGDWG